MRLDVLLAILGMALVTYASRAGGYAVLRVVRPPPFVQALLRHLPGCLFVAYVTPPLLAGGWHGWLGAVVVMVVQVATRNLGLSILAGIGAVWGLHAGLSWAELS